MDKAPKYWFGEMATLRGVSLQEWLDMTPRVHPGDDVALRWPATWILFMGCWSHGVRLVRGASDVHGLFDNVQMHVVKI